MHNMSGLLALNDPLDLICIGDVETNALAVRLIDAAAGGSIRKHQAAIAWQYDFQFLDQVAADKSVGSRNQNPHRLIQTHLLNRSAA
jgi:hypothetical protein